MNTDNKLVEELFEEIKEEKEKEGVQINTRDLRLAVSDHIHGIGEGLD